MVDGELRCADVLMVGGEVGDFGEQQGLKGDLRVALVWHGEGWRWLATSNGGARRRSSSGTLLAATSEMAKQWGPAEAYVGARGGVTDSSLEINLV